MRSHGPAVRATLACSFENGLCMAAHARKGVSSSWWLHLRICCAQIALAALLLVLGLCMQQAAAQDVSGIGATVSVAVPRGATPQLDPSTTCDIMRTIFQRLLPPSPVPVVGINCVLSTPVTGPIASRANYTVRLGCMCMARLQHSTRGAGRLPHSCLPCMHGCRSLTDAFTLAATKLY